jgi:hypothetical protein
MAMYFSSTKPGATNPLIIRGILTCLRPATERHYGFFSVFKPLTIVCFLINTPSLANAQSIDLSQHHLNVPTQCIAIAQACVAETDSQIAHISNPATLASTPTNAFNYYLHASRFTPKVSEALSQEQNSKDQLNATDDFGLGVKLQTTNFGVAVDAGLQNFEESQSALSKNGSTYHLSQVSLKFGAKIDQTLKFGLSMYWYSFYQTDRDTPQQIDEPKYSNRRFVARNFELGLFKTIKGSSSSSIGFTYRPGRRLRELMHSKNDTTPSGQLAALALDQAISAPSASSLTTSSNFGVAEAIKIGWGTAVNRLKNIRLSTQLELVETSLGDGVLAAHTLPTIKSSVGLRLSSSGLILADSLGFGSYFISDRHHNQFQRHYTAGLAKNYSVFTIPLTFEFAVDHSSLGNDYLISIF